MEAEVRELDAGGPLAVGPLRRFLAAHVVPGLERHDPATGAHVRAVRHSGSATVVQVRVDDDGRVLAHPLAGAAGDGWVAPVRRWLGLDADVVAAEAALAQDPLIGPMVAARPGLRVPGTVDGAETAVMAVVGQQVSLAAACTFAGRLVETYGEPVDGAHGGGRPSGPSSGPGGGGHGLRLFPAPEVLARAGAAGVRASTGLTNARSATVAALAEVLAGGLDLSPGQDSAARAAARAELLAVPGIGPWTADYVALRALGDPDAFLPGDLVAKRALGVGSARAAEAAAQGWSPWRAHALLHLWTAAVFV